VSRRKPLRDLQGDLRRLAQWQGASRHLLSERLPFEQLADEIGRTVKDPRVVDGEDVWMIQSCERLRLLLEAAQPVGVGCEIDRQNFDRHLAMKPCVPGAEHLAHSAPAEPRRNFVVTDRFSNHAGILVTMIIRSQYARSTFKLLAAR
jgi:hypothetical protein